VTRVEKVAKKRGISMAQVAVAWTLSKEGELTVMMIAKA
jgi:aryl-alcohol dehydrogenase-like predicted oxidoreductase